MDETLRAQIDSNIALLESLTARGRRIHDSLEKDPNDKSAIVANRAWQQDCGVAVNQLSGGSKAHWLARAFSEAFLLRTVSGQVIEAAAPAEIVERLVAVLGQAVDSLSQMAEAQGPSIPSAAAPAPRRFEFVHNKELRPVLEQAFLDGREALDRGRHAEALTAGCGILEAIVTDALEHKGVKELAAEGGPAGKISDWPFETRLAVAESAGLIRGGWVRLTEAARTYRDEGHKKITEQDAKRAMQVLHVVMRDLDPGR